MFEMTNVYLLLLGTTITGWPSRSTILRGSIAVEDINLMKG